MKVLQLTAHFSPNLGGVETHLDDLLGVLAHKGYEIFVLTYMPLSTSAKWKVWESSKNLRILRIPWISGLFYRLVSSPILEFFYLFPGLFVVLPFVLIVNRPDVIHSHGLVAGFVGVFWGRIFGIRVITTTHSIYHFPKSGLYFRFVKWVFGNSDKVLTLSKQSAGEVEALGVDKRKVRTFTYWVDLDKFKTKDPKPKTKSEGKFTVLFVGRLIEEKGILVLVESVKKWNKNISLIIAGDGPLARDVIRKTQNDTRIEYIGRVEQDKLPLVYASTDLTIVPSIHEEGFGRVIMESLACGTPVIAANRGGIPEAMDTSVGRLIDISPEEIAKNVNYLYNNPEQLKKLSAKARTLAVTKYSDKNAETIIKSYTG